MIALLLVILVLIALGVFGAVVKGLLWLTFVAIALIVASAIYGWFKLRGSSSSTTT